MIFKEFYPSHMKNRIKEDTKQDSIIKNPLKLMGENA